MTGTQKCSMLNAVSPSLLSFCIDWGSVQSGRASITPNAREMRASCEINLGVLNVGMDDLVPGGSAG